MNNNTKTVDINGKPKPSLVRRVVGIQDPSQRSFTRGWVEGCVVGAGIGVTALCVIKGVELLLTQGQE